MPAPRRPSPPRARPRPGRGRLAAAAAVLLLAGGTVSATASGSGGSDASAPRAAGATHGPRCAGAATRAPVRPCRNPALRTRVVPTPEDALLVPDAPCTPAPTPPTPAPCLFGRPPGSGATATVALLGDSHASHWRAALTVAAGAAGWQGVSLTRSSCPFSLARARIAPEAQGPCRDFVAGVIAYLRGRPDIHTVFVSAHSGARVFRDPGRNALETKVAGFRAAWAALPPTVRRIVVLRDVPAYPRSTAGCVDAAVAAGRPPGPACAEPRRQALVADAEVVAARRLRSARVATIDLTPFMCDAARCYPVVGGVLVDKDTDHLTRAFSATLGPYLLARARRAGVTG